MATAAGGGGRRARVEVRPGDVYGRLTVVEFHDWTRFGQTVWHCTCICGGTALVGASLLVRGSTRSCGCLQSESARQRLAQIHQGRPFRRFSVGQRFARLTIVAAAPSRGGRTHWRCRCDCGREVVVRGANLSSGNTRSCGCWHREQSSRAVRERRLTERSLAARAAKKLDGSSTAPRASRCERKVIGLPNPAEFRANPADVAVTPAALAPCGVPRHDADPEVTRA